MDIDQDIEYFRHKLRQRLISSGRSLGKTRTQLALLEDAVVIYHEQRRNPSTVEAWMGFGFSEEQAMRMVSGKYHRMPQSLLVQTFMRKLRDDLDRR